MHSQHLDSRDVKFTLDEFKDISRSKGSAWGQARSRLPSARSEAMLSVIASGVSIADMTRPRSRAGSTVH